MWTNFLKHAASPGLRDALVALECDAFSRLDLQVRCVRAATSLIRMNSMHRAKRRRSAVACYIDLLPANDQRWTSPSKRELAAKLVRATARCSAARCRVDLVIRHAVAHRSESSVRHHRLSDGLRSDGERMRDSRLGACSACFADAVVPAQALPVAHRFKVTMRKHGRVAQSDRAPAF